MLYPGYASFAVFHLVVDLDDVEAHLERCGIKGEVAARRRDELSLLFGRDRRGGARLVWVFCPEKPRFYLDEYYVFAVAC